MNQSSRLYAGVRIYITANGNYTATVGGRRVVTRTLAELKTAITKGGK